jgi:hypothetical protein
MPPATIMTSDTMVARTAAAVALFGALVTNVMAKPEAIGTKKNITHPMAWLLESAPAKIPRYPG